jgi:hypothetical protein
LYSYYNLARLAKTPDKALKILDILIQADSISDSQNQFKYAYNFK